MTRFPKLTKHCPKCNKEKSILDFGKLKVSKDGFNYNCKECQTKKMQDWIAISGNREKSNRNAARYRRTNKGDIVRKRYYHSAKGQKSHKEYSQRKRKETNKIKAREAVNHAVEVGKIPKAKTQICSMNSDGCKGRMEYHHHEGYDKSHWLNVIPLCKKHHCTVDNINYHSNL